MENMVSESLENFVKCKVCGALLHFISWNHLSKHDMTREEYQEAYPGSPLCAQGYKNQRGFQTRQFFKENPSAKEKLSKAQTERFQNQQERQRHSTRMKQMFLNQDVKKRHRDGVIESWSPERRKQLSDTIEKQWYNDPERRKRLSERMKKRWKQNRRKLAKNIKELSQRPDIRARMKTGQKELSQVLANLAQEYMSRGYQAVPLHHGFPVPDIILFKDGRVLAVEVGEDRSHRPNKYEAMMAYYDEIVWLRKQKKYGI